LPFPFSFPTVDDDVEVDDVEKSPLVELAVLLGVVDPILGVFVPSPSGGVVRSTESSGAILFERFDEEDLFVFVPFEEESVEEEEDFAASAANASSFVNDALEPVSNANRDSELRDRDPKLFRPGVPDCP
jgi:hypothetical protein